MKFINLFFIRSLLSEDSGFSPDPFVNGESKKTFANASNPSLSMYSNEGYVYGKFFYSICNSFQTAIVMLFGRLIDSLTYLWFLKGIYPCRGCAENIGLQSSPEMLSHFGVWLLISLCPPAEGIEHVTLTTLNASNL